MDKGEFIVSLARFRELDIGVSTFVPFLGNLYLYAPRCVLRIHEESFSVRFDICNWCGPDTPSYFLFL